MVVKYPSQSADQPDKRFCGQCGRLCQPLLNDNVGFGPCIDGADSPIECGDLRRAIASSYSLARFWDKGVHPDTQALVKRLGIPETLVTEWVESAARVSKAADEIRAARYDDASFVSQLMNWVRASDSGERLLILIEEMRTALDPTEGKRGCTYAAICDWHESLAKRAHAPLLDPGDWETSEDAA